MRAGIVVLGLAGIICAGLLVFTLEAQRAKAGFEAQLAVALRHQVVVRAALGKAEQTVVPRPAPVLQTESAPAAEQAVPARAPNLMDLAHNNPQLLNLFVADQRSRLQQRYGVLLENLRLTPAQRQQFKDIVAAGVAREIDISAAANAQGFLFEDPAIRKLRQDSVQQKQTELKALLGEHGYHEFKEFGRTEMVRSFVGGYAVQVASDVPIMASQAEQLVRAIAAASPAYQKGDAAKTTDADWAAVDRTAEAILSPVQFTAWKLGIARLDIELRKAYDTAAAKTPGGRPGG